VVPLEIVDVAGALNVTDVEVNAVTVVLSGIFVLL